MQIGFPLGLQSVHVNISFLIITIIVNQMGLIASASLGVVGKLMEFLMLPAIALGLTFVMLYFNNEITLLMNTPKEAIEATKS